MTVKTMNAKTFRLQLKPRVYSFKIHVLEREKGKNQLVKLHYKT